MFSMKGKLFALSVPRNLIWRGEIAALDWRDKAREDSAKGRCEVLWK
jgi:hypothetical protein